MELFRVLEKQFLTSCQWCWYGEWTMHEVPKVEGNNRFPVRPRYSSLKFAGWGKIHNNTFYEFL